MNGIPDNQKSESAPNVNQPIGIGKRCPRCQKERRKEMSHRNYLKHREEKLLKQKNYSEEQKEKHREMNRNSYRKHREGRLEKNKQWAKTNPHIRNDWRSKNKDKVLQYYRKYGAKRRSDPQKRLNGNIATVIARSLQDGGKGREHWECLVDFTLEQLIKHLEKQFIGKMNWGNYGSYWWIDHKVPVSAFNFEKPKDIDFKQCWALKNLQPLERIANIKKSDKVVTPFQPSLSISV